MIGNPSKKGMVERYTIQDPLTGSDVLLYKWKYCRAMVYENLLKVGCMMKIMWSWSKRGGGVMTASSPTEKRLS